MGYVKKLLFLLLLSCKLVCLPLEENELIRDFDFLDCCAEKGYLTRNAFFNEDCYKKEDNFVVIGLGCNCHPAWYTRQYGIRTYAFPLDWCLTPYESLYWLLSNNFQHYFAKENLIPSSRIYFPVHLQNFVDKCNYAEISEGIGWVLDKSRGILYNHDFSNNKPITIDTEYQSNYAKYLRRVQRMYDEINSDKHIYFIRFHDITKSQSIELYELLNLKFTQASFKLIVIGDNPQEFRESWNLPNIKNFYSVGPDEPFWKKLCQDIQEGTL